MHFSLLCNHKRTCWLLINVYAQGFKSKLLYWLCSFLLYKVVNVIAYCWSTYLLEQLRQNWFVDQYICSRNCNKIIHYYAYSMFFWAIQNVIFCELINYVLISWPFIKIFTKPSNWLLLKDKPDLFLSYCYLQVLNCNITFLPGILLPASSWL